MLNISIAFYPLFVDDATQTVDISSSSGSSIGVIFIFITIIVI